MGFGFWGLGFGAQHLGITGKSCHVGRDILLVHKILQLPAKSLVKQQFWGNGTDNIGNADCNSNTTNKSTRKVRRIRPFPTTCGLT